MGVVTSVESSSNFVPLSDDILAGVVRGENLAAERLVAVATPVTPLDIGTLRGAMQVVAATDPEEGSAVVVDTPYAARLHEHPEYNFQTPGTGAKYVENPALEHRDEFAQIIATAASRG